MTGTLHWLWQSHDHRLHTILLLHGMCNGDEPILDGQLLFSLPGQRRPPVCGVDDLSAAQLRVWQRAGLTAEACASMAWVGG